MLHVLLPVSGYWICKGRRSVCSNPDASNSKSNRKSELEKLYLAPQPTEIIPFLCW